jgi:hypothetical protein
LEISTTQYGVMGGVWIYPIPYLELSAMVGPGFYTMNERRLSDFFYGYKLGAAWGASATGVIPVHKGATFAQCILVGLNYRGVYAEQTVSANKATAHSVAVFVGYGLRTANHFKK